MTQQTILVVDDDAKIRTLLRNVLEAESFVVLEAATRSEVLDTLDRKAVHLITLDLHLGPDDGLQIAREIRKFSNVPIIMVSGRDDVIDRVVGLEIGADDYITKPFHVREVIARIRTVLRRVHASEEGEAASGQDAKRPGPEQSWHFCFDGMTAVPDRLELVDREGVQYDLTSGDFKLLTIFLERPKRVLSRDQLMDLNSGQGYSPLDRTIDNQIARLRKKIERDPSEPKLIKTVRGVGYMFACNVTTVQGNGVSVETG
jgi:DNA-binding response OmpR family regulator